MAPNITYKKNLPLELDSFIELYHASTLGQRRPVDDRARMQSMLTQANLIITAWDGDLLVGLSRALSDFGHATYLADLAVRQSYQRQGIGKNLIRQTKLAAPQTNIILLAAPAAVDYYPHIGFSAHQSAWILSEGDQL